MAFLRVFRFICLVTAYPFSPCFLISSFQIMGNHLVQFQLPHVRDEQTEWCLTSHSPVGRDLLSPRAVHHGLLNTGFKDGRANLGMSPTFSYSCFLDQSLDCSHAILANHVSYFQRRLKFLPFENTVLTLTALGTTAEEPWPCWEPLHARWDSIFPEYLGEEKQ